MFIATFIVTSKTIAYTAQLIVGLQKKALDIVKAYQHMKVVMDTVDSVRQSVDEYHEKWFIEAVDMAKSVDVQPAMPRICSRQTQRDNAPSSIPSEYFKRNVTIPFGSLMNYRTNEAAIFLCATDSCFWFITYSHSISL